MTINVWPNGCVCQAVRAPRSKVTLAPRTRPGSGASNSGSMRTVPVNQSAGPLVDASDPTLLISMFKSRLKFLTMPVRQIPRRSIIGRLRCMISGQIKDSREDAAGKMFPESAGYWANKNRTQDVFISRRTGLMHTMARC